MKMSGFSSSRRGFFSYLAASWRTFIEIDSTPPAMATSVWPEAIWLAAKAIA